jgi:hypothetical protein
VRRRIGKSSVRQTASGRKAGDCLVERTLCAMTVGREECKRRECRVASRGLETDGRSFTLTERRQ